MTTERAGTRERRRLTGGLLARLVLGGAAAAVASLPVLALLALVRSSWGPLAGLDQLALERLHQVALHSPALVGVWQVIAVVFSPTVFQLVVLAVSVRLWRRGSHRLAAWAVVTALTGGLASRGVKELVERARPALPDPVGTAAGYSFPSGHALGSFVGCGVLLLLLGPGRSRSWRVGAALLAGLVVLVTGLDRVGLGVHYPSDVLAGWLLGLAVLTGTSVAFGTWRAGSRPVAPGAPESEDEGPFEAVSAEAEETAGNA